MKQLITVLILIVISSSVGVNDIQSQEIKTNKCASYFDSTFVKWIHINYDIPPKLPDGKNVMVDIAGLITIPKDFLDENNEFVYVIPFSIAIIIDEDGRVLSHEISEKPKSQYTAYEKIVARAFETEMQWIPAQCGGVNVASRYWLSMNIHYRKRY